jgi:hypothetical protein
LLANLQHRLPLAALVNQHPAQAKPGRAALLVSELNQPARTLKNFGRQLAAVFTGHCALVPA